MYKAKTQSLEVKAGAKYPYSTEIIEELSYDSKYGDDIPLYRITTIQGRKFVTIPRNCAPEPTELNDRRTTGFPISVRASVKFIPRGNQESLIDKTTTLLLNGVSHISQSYTGSGKTVMTSQVIARVGVKTLIVVHKEDLRDQWIKTLTEFLVIKRSRIGIIQGDIFEVEGKDIVIAMVQSISLMGRYPEKDLASFGFMIVDEVHRIATSGFSKVCWIIPAKLRLGLSATPIRKDGKSIMLKAHIGRVLVSDDAYTVVPEVKVLISNFIVPMVKIRKNGVLKLVKMPHFIGRTMNVVKAMSLDIDRNLLIATTIKSLMRQERKIIVTSEIVDHLYAIRILLNRLGVPFESIALYIGGLTKSERARAVKKEVILATYKYVTDSTDIKTLDTIIMATPRADIVQVVGRVLRGYSQNTPLVIDIVDTDSPILSAYYRARKKWYALKNVKIIKRIFR